jgi:APA family basic amino acid/polyamine antiporter
MTATCLVVANMIGTGIFTSLHFQVGDLPSGFTLLVLWFLGGICALCGALAYGELAAALPRSGGEYHFLTEIFHPSIGFLAGWISATVGFAAPVALAAMAFGEYFSHVVSFVSPTAASLFAVLLISAVHSFGIRFSSVFQNAATLLKVLLIFALIGFGLAVRNPQPVSFLPTASDPALLTSAPFATSLVYVMYAYSGWNASTYIAGEIRNPARAIPLSLAMGTLFVTALYVLLIGVFLYTAPMSELAAEIEVGHVAAAHIFGEAGGRMMAALICAGLVSSISAMTWAGPRVTMVMGEDLHPLRFLARKSARGIPLPALAAQAVIVIALLLTATFKTVLTYIQFSLTLCSFLAVLGVFVLRWRRPALLRPYKTWGYPVTPLIFLIITLWMLWHIAHQQPWESLAGVGTMLLGLIVFLCGRSAGRAL